MIEYFSEHSNATRKTEGEHKGWMSQCDIAALCHWDLSIKEHRALLEELLPALASSSEEWDEQKPYEAMMKRRGELKYFSPKTWLVNPRRS